ncbi:hypothetical protein GCM10011390_08560 [Aureimonas endophytica]|uniref:Lectin-like protein BA14k n=1 Tax=Aureimonas endophytica TaxID=2027858 RepID=A0A917E1E8_9HYPH|nr:BA14K family protein [Aureimonas endophytica]GGD92136.1 hypothetical protein GCM10011390_08560 [Aureimonas endophytica]
MKILRFAGARLLAVALAFSFVPAVAPSGTPLIGVQTASAAPWNDGVPGNWRRHGGYNHGPGYYPRGRYYGGDRRYYRDRRSYDRRYYRHNNTGAAVAAGIIGLGVGAAIANSARPRYAAPPVYRGGLSAHDRYCLSKYRSYDPASGTYQPYNGPRRYCR